MCTYFDSKDVCDQVGGSLPLAISLLDILGGINYFNSLCFYTQISIDFSFINN